MSAPLFPYLIAVPKYLFSLYFYIVYLKIILYFLFYLDYYHVHQKFHLRNDNNHFCKNVFVEYISIYDIYLAKLNTIEKSLGNNVIPYKDSIIFMCESYDLCTFQKHHKLKLVLF